MWRPAGKHHAKESSRQPWNSHIIFSGPLKGSLPKDQFAPCRGRPLTTASTQHPGYTHSSNGYRVQGGWQMRSNGLAAREASKTLCWPRVRVYTTSVLTSPAASSSSNVSASVAAVRQNVGRRQCEGKLRKGRGWATRHLLARCKRGCWEHCAAMFKVSMVRPPGDSGSESCCPSVHAGERLP